MLHERCLRLIYNGQQSSFIELLNKDNSVSIHIRNIQKAKDLQLKCLGSIIDYHHH